MRYCKRCLYPENHPLGLIIDDEGICSGCRVHEEKFTLDWEARFQKLQKIVDGYKRRSPGAGFDCIVPVTGDRDHYFIVDTVVNKLGLTPLLVEYNQHYNTPRGIRNMAYLRTNFDGDYMQNVISPLTIKRIARETMREIASFHWQSLAGRTVWPVQVAVRLKIPLIIWGAHQGLDQVGMFSHEDEVEMTRKYRCEHDLMGLEAEDLIGLSENLTEQDLRAFMYPSDREISRVGVRGIYLGNYIPWDTKAQHERMIEDFDYETAQLQRTFDTYNDVNCQHYTGYHDQIKFQKWGYSKVTDHACREIRWSRLSRNEGAALVKQYQDIEPQDKQTFLDWIEMDANEAQACIDRHRDPAIWEKEDGKWQLKDSVFNHLDEDGCDAATLTRQGKGCDFVLSENKNPTRNENQYALIEKGYVMDKPARNRAHKTI